MKKQRHLRGNQSGQISIFLGISLLLVTTLLAFIVNIGLFVRAKINLQNAVDAAAFSGAAVQARQLSNIAYLNWELRNTYKEWMFKYYVLGQLGLRSLRDTATSPDLAHFRMKPFFPGPGVEPDVYDRFNMPSICVHFGSEANICEIFQIPGLPRFDTIDTGIPGIAEHHRTFIDSIVATKANDCSVRSDLNYATAANWVYGTKRALTSNVPIVSSDRPGAWIESVELSIRMRNLEALVNRPPVAQPMCFGGSGCLDVTSLDNIDSDFPSNERPVKAFWSAYRNLGGGPNKKDLSIAKNFKLTELAPQPFDAPPNSLSSFLIPPDATMDGIPATQKHYLDLRAYPVNLVTFFTTFVSTTTTSTLADVAAEGACGGTKTALPVPGYILGFAKNPNVLTYYAVKGETRFVGLFFPFTERDGIQLTAYAAAKPFGGRIGPKLFGELGESGVTARDGNRQARTAPYLSGIDINSLGTTYSPGLPIPLAPQFWVTDPGQTVGGIPLSGNVVRYAIPNLMYDFTTEADLTRQQGGLGARMTILRSVTSKLDAQNNANGESLGLYDYRQYEKFLGVLLDDPGVVSAIDTLENPINSTMIRQAIYRSRRPTRYEALNYMIPHINSTPGLLELPQSVENASPTDQVAGKGESYEYSLYAPLFGPGTLLETPEFILTTVQNYQNSLADAVSTYLEALEGVATQMAAEYPTAASTLFVKADTEEPYATACEGTKIPSMAGKFAIFFKHQGNGVCDVPALVNETNEYFTRQSTSNPAYRLFHQTTYTTNPNLPTDLMMTGYMPGPRSGSDATARLLNPVASEESTIRAKRNIYSTKFIPIEKLIDTNCSGTTSSPGTYCTSYFEEDDIGSIIPDIAPIAPHNRLSTDLRTELGIDGQLRF
jgi:hypothetical protein